MYAVAKNDLSSTRWVFSCAVSLKVKYGPRITSLNVPMFSKNSFRISFIFMSLGEC